MVTLHHEAPQVLGILSSLDVGGGDEVHAVGAGKVLDVVEGGLGQGRGGDGTAWEDHLQAKMHALCGGLLSCGYRVEAGSEFLSVCMAKELHEVCLISM